MTTSVQSLASWLLERITEDEAAAKAVDSHDWSELRYMAPGYTLARVRAECEAKRRIVELHAEFTEREFVSKPSHLVPRGYCQTCTDWHDAKYDWDGPGTVAWPCPTLRLLAVPYADHEGYREEWAV